MKRYYPILTGMLLAACSETNLAFEPPMEPMYEPSPTSTVQVVSTVDGYRPVDFETAQDVTSVVTYKGNIYWAYIKAGATRKFTVVKKEGDKMTEHEIFPIEMDVADIWHVCPTLGVDKKGRLHVTADMHNQPWKYYISDRPEDITSWTKRTDMDGNFITYPYILYDNNKELYLLFRHTNNRGIGSIGNHRGGIIRYDADADQFVTMGGVNYEDEKDKAPVPVKTMVWGNGFGGHDGWYVKIGHRIHVDNSGRMHLMAGLINKFIPKPYGYESNTHIIYAYSDDKGVTWKKVTGEAIAGLPLTVDNASVVLERMNQNDIYGGESELGAFAPDRPVISYKLSSDESVHNLMWNGSQWVEIYPPNRTNMLVSARDGFSAWCDGNSIHYTSDGVNWQQGTGQLPGGLNMTPCAGVDREHFNETREFRYQAKYGWSKSAIVTVKRVEQPTQQMK